MATQRVQIGVSFQTLQTVYVAASPGGAANTEITVYVPVVGAAITIVDRDTGNAPTVYLTETGSSTTSSLTTDSGGNVDGWVIEGSYTVTAAAVSGFAGATVGWEAVRGDGVENIKSGAVVLTSLAQEIVNFLVPSGTILDHGGGVAPPGYVLCDGSVYATGAAGSTYYNLSQALNGAWNTGGEGTGNFRVPDLRGRTTIGKGFGPGLTNRAFASTLGEENHLLAVAELASHTHTDNGHNHGTSDPGHAHAISDPGHGHVYQWIGTGSGSFNNGGNYTTRGLGSTATNIAGTGIGIFGAYTGLSILGAAAQITATGSNVPHNNMQPSAVTNKIIKI